MKLEWDGKIGPATIISGLGALSILVTVGIMWGQQTSKTDAARSEASEAKTLIAEQIKHGAVRDRVINEHSVTLGEIKTTLGFIGPALQRIETKIDAGKP